MVNVHALMMWRCRGWAGVGMWTLCDRLRGPSWYLDQDEQDEQTEGEMVLKTVAASLCVDCRRLSSAHWVGWSVTFEVSELVIHILIPSGRNYL